jgi:CheY-like chemotaxis protein
MSQESSRILIISKDKALNYLIGRYAEQSGYEINRSSAIPLPEEALHLHPPAIVFASIERLEAAQTFIEGLKNSDIPVLVCSSSSDEERALEFGADRCLVQPITYEAFLSALQPNK